MDQIQKYLPYTIIIITIITISIILVYYFTKNNETSIEESYSDTFTKTTDESNTMKADQVDQELILYYAEWCGHSRAFLDEWDKFTLYAKNNIPTLKVTKMKCEGETEQVCSQRGVQGYPTVILYKNNNEIPFNDDRTADALISFIKSN